MLEGLLIEKLRHFNMKFISLALIISVAATHGHGSVCDTDICNSPVTQPSKVEDYCQEKKLYFSHRCCLNSTDSVSNFTDSDIVGIDLRNCNLRNVTDLFKNMTSVVIISLEDNPLSVTEADFYHLTQLEHLSLPKKVDDCPGGSQAWNESSRFNETLFCDNQVNTCETEVNNGTCPTPQSYCSPAGPGLVDCLCSPGYHGYKCLRQGTFPMIPFVSGICGSTLVTALFLWVTQRRFVKKH